MQKIINFEDYKNKIADENISDFDEKHEELDVE